MGRKLIGNATLFFLFINYEALGTTINEAVITALDTHPSIDEDKFTAKADDIAIDAARAGYLPSLDIVNSSVGYQRFKINQKLDPPLSFPLKGAVTRFVSNPTVVLSQTIFDGFATTYAVELAHRQAEAAYAILGQTEEQVAFSAISAFVGLLAQQNLLELTKEIIEKHVEILDKVKKRVTGGISTIADVYQVESRLDQAIAVKEKTEGQLAVAFANFIDAVGFSPEDKLEVPQLPEEPILSKLECMLTRVSQHNPGVIVEERNLKIAKASLDQTLSPFMPKIRAQLISNGPIYNLQGTRGHQSSLTAQLVLDYNLFSGGKDWSNFKAQQQRVLSAIKRVEVAKRNAAKVFRTAWGTYVSDKNQIIILQEAVEVNIKLQRAYELQFSLVARPLVDVLDAYVSYYRSKNDLIIAEAEKDTNHALLLASMGDLVCTIRRKGLK